jgi:amino acid transporter
VFASDNLSSVAYATQEMLVVLVPAVGLAAFSLVFPLSLVVVGLEAILIFSYRQTIKAYPSAGGAYIVTRDNFGLLTAQVAGVALLVDYVLTVAVSVAAGVQALSSVVGVVHAYRIPIALAFVALLAYGNLLGVRESGRLFGLPTYLFITSLFLTVGLGMFRVLTGSVERLSVPAGDAIPVGAGAISLFLVLRAFASGGAAVTGVEAISNGVPAFRKPEWRNAQSTLTWMGLILGSSFIGVSFLASRLHAVPFADESKSVLAQIAEAVYGTGAVGHALFLVLQGSTMLILILAANTSFADFPRLASFQAGDDFLPRQLTKRGHRLVFSNGVIWLAVAAGVVLIVFKASVTELIPLYAIGVFTSFTLSQAGMAKRHLRLRETGWRRGLLINGTGAVVTFIVDVVIAVVKFADGAWMVMVAIPVLVAVFVRVNRTYEGEDRDLLDGLARLDQTPPARQIAVVLVDDVDEKTLHAVQYALTIRPQELHAINVVTDTSVASSLGEEWERRLPHVRLEAVACPDGRRAHCVAEYVRGRAQPDSQVTVIAPGPSRMGLWERIRRGRSWSELADSLQDLENVSLAVVRDHGGPGHLSREGRVQVSPRARHRVVIMVGQLDRSIVKALRYARAVDAEDIHALHIAVDRDQGERLLRQWSVLAHSLGIALSVQDCPDRDIGREVRSYVNEIKGRDAEVTVILPRRRYPRLLQRLLHDRTSREIARALRDEAHVDIVIVPYRLGRGAQPTEVPRETVPAAAR